MNAKTLRRRLCWLTCGLAALTAGCATGLSTIFNDQFLTDLGLTQRAASLPGAAPAVLVLVENRTARTVEARISMRLLADTVDSFVVVIPPGTSSGRAIVCPLSEITLGDIGDLDASGATVRLGDGTADDPVIEVEAFGVLLKSGANYDCGDSVTFAVSPSSNTRSGYQTIAFVQRSP